MFVRFWDYVLSLQFLIPFGLVLAFFLPMLYSMLQTFLENDGEEAKQR